MRRVKILNISHGVLLGQDEPVNLPCQAPIINDNDLIILQDFISTNSYNQNGITKHTS